MIREITCIGCPMGCRIYAELSGENISSITGFECKIGEKYAREELTLPKRMVTSLACVQGREMPLSVKTNHPIDKSRIFDCLREISKVKVTAPILIGEVILPHVCGTDVDIVATKDIW